MLFQTTQRGWQVLGVEPFEDDDLKLSADHKANDTAEKEIVAYAGQHDELTLVGLDTHGRGLNGVSGQTPSYSIGGLPPSTNLKLVLWNASGNGENSDAGIVPINAAGVARFEVPLHAAFALTTLPVS